MAKIAFTVKDIEKLAGDGTERYLWDAKQPGLGLRVNETGKVFFVAQYRVKGSGKRRRVALGPYGVLTLDEARDRARRYASAAREGKDLHADLEEKANRITLDALVDKWMELHVRPKRSPRTALDYQKIYKTHLKHKFGRSVVEEVRRSEVLALHASMLKTPKVADYAIVVGKAVVNFGIKNGFLNAAMVNPFAGIELFGQEGRERFLSHDEVARIGQALDELEASQLLTPWSAAAIRLLVLTGARKSEILTLRWEWVDFEQSVLFLPKSKTGKRRIELNPAAVAVLNSIPRVKGNDFVIVGQKPKSHMISLTTPWLRICKKAGIRNCRVHDLRHTFASFAAADGLSLLMIGKLLGHSVPATTQRYAHLAEAALKRANDELGSKLADLIGTRPKADKVS